MEVELTNGRSGGGLMVKERDEEVPNAIDVVLRHVESKAADLGDRLNRHAERIDKRNVDVETRLRALEDFKAKAYGAIAIVGAVFGLGGALLGKFLR